MVQTHHSPPEGVRVALEVGLECVGPHGVLLGEVDEVAGEDEAQEADVQRRDQLLKEGHYWEMSPSNSPSKKNYSLESVSTVSSHV